MKVYSYSNSQLKVAGMLLLSDKGQIYAIDSFNVCSNDENNAHMLAIMRAVSFVKNVKPLYAKQDLEIVNYRLYDRSFQKALLSNAYINDFMSLNNIGIVFAKNPSEDDKKYLTILKNQCTMKERLIVSKGLER